MPDEAAFDRALPRGAPPSAGGAASPFAEPWQAQLHAITVALHEVGALDWGEWTRALGARLGAPDAAPDGSDHHERALDALIDLLDAGEVAPRAEVARLAEAWRRAAEATPHGEPITLERDPLATRPREAAPEG